MMNDAGEFDRAIAQHDAALEALGLDIWIGNEPTFTDRYSQATEWLTSALGDDKHRRASQLLAELARQQPGSAVLRSVGRQYPGESTPRWCLGLYSRRDGAPLWSGSPDPALAQQDGVPDLSAFHREIERALGRRGFACRAFRAEAERRIVFARSGGAVPDALGDARLARPSIHAGAIPEGGLRDELANDGLYLFLLTSLDEGTRPIACLELPAVAEVELFCALLAAVAEASTACALPALVLRGFAPPVDRTVSFTTVTPDPAVVEVNMAPHATVAGFLQHNRRCYAAAAALGLSPYRLYYNGSVVDSGGGGQITLGGPSPRESPFFLVPQLLPHLVGYVQRHPALSYLFAHDYTGPSGQSVRPDEHGADALSELRLALALLGRATTFDPAMLWRSLAYCLTDPTGNSHRAEINIEKLWNSGLPGRGLLGLVEFRAFRMQHTPERAAALAALLRAILAMLATRNAHEELVDWGAVLHDRFALPFYLEADLGAVLQNLEQAGVGLPAPIAAELSSDRWRVWHALEIAGCILTVRRALEFWPLVGDASFQQGTSRLVDASTSRIELTLRAPAASDPSTLAGWRLRANGIELPLRNERDAQGEVSVFGVRYRSFVPSIGLHPTLGTQVPLRLLLTHPALADAFEITLHEWNPAGEAYDGVPKDLAEAGARRAGRCVMQRVPAHELPPPQPAPPGSLSPCTLDLRYSC